MNQLHRSTNFALYSIHHLVGQGKASSIIQFDMRKFNQLKFILLFLMLASPFAGRMAQAQIIYGASPFQDSLWAVDTTNWTIISRMGPTLAGFTITGMNGLAYDPVGHDTYVIMKLSGVTSGRVLGQNRLANGGLHPGRQSRQLIFPTIALHLMHSGQLFAYDRRWSHSTRNALQDRQRQRLYDAASRLGQWRRW
jgi:hypothetical protein